MTDATFYSGMVFGIAGGALGTFRLGVGGEVRKRSGVEEQPQSKRL